MSNYKIDDFDRRLLEVLQENNLIPAERIAERVGLSVSAVQRRARRLRKEQVIVADVSVVEPKAVGRGAAFIVEVTLERESREIVEAFKARIRVAPEVQQCFYVTGDADFVLFVTARDIADYESIIERLFNDRGIRKFKTAVVLSTVKTSLLVPIGEERR
ncbi:Lrp/AsnC family transcriptional regulator [Phenylobacterium sp.]|uniref:Lrp/AsnC family transcriptional regulator n=1 Tax=Phenylobacterium sp. TaxID=1871053 RepID=UPI002FC9C43D